MTVGTRKGVETRRQRREQYIAAGGYGSPEWKRKISDTVTRLYLEGGFQWSRGEFISSRTGKRFYYRSAWELQRMMELDDDPDVESWEYEPFVIHYTLDDVRHSYLPDFLVRNRDGSTFLEEVGPKAVKESAEINVRKRAAAEGYCDARGFIYRTWEPVA